MAHLSMKLSLDSVMAFLFFAVVAFSCSLPRSGSLNSKKNNQHSYVITSVLFDGDPLSQHHYYYNQSGDVIKSIVGLDTMHYLYSNKKIIKTYMNKTSWLSKVIYSTDDQGRIIKAVLYDNSNDTIGSMAYDYNNQGYLMEVRHKSQHLKLEKRYKFKYIAGNLHEITEWTQSGSLQNVFSFDYYYHQNNVFSADVFSLFEREMIVGRVGLPNQNLIRQQMNLSPAGDTLALLQMEYKINETQKSIHVTQRDVLNGEKSNIVYQIQ